MLGMRKLILLGTSACHLCDQAEDLLKNTNIAIGEELLALKERDMALNLEIEKLKTQLNQSPQNASQEKRTHRRRSKEESKEKASSSSNKNFTWE